MHVFFRGFFLTRKKKTFFFCTSITIWSNIICNYSSSTARCRKLFRINNKIASYIFIVHLEIMSNSIQGESFSKSRTRKIVEGFFLNFSFHWRVFSVKHESSFLWNSFSCIRWRYITNIKRNSTLNRWCYWFKWNMYCFINCEVNIIEKQLNKNFKN
jgi:hypothetical protein